MSRVITQGLMAALFAVPALALFSAAAAIETPARHALLMDAHTGAVLFDKGGHEPMPPASMSKIMTMTMLFEALRDEQITLDDAFPISEYAWRTGGAPSGSSTMFAEVNSLVPVRALIRGVVVQSGNDAAIAIAEGLSGSEEAFAAAMNRRARQIGLTDSHFTNATGLPDPDHAMTARDLAWLARYNINTLGGYYPYYRETLFTWNGVSQRNRNALLKSLPGADGLKTGHTSAAGYGTVVSARRGDRRLILVLGGLASAAERDRQARRLLQWGFAAFRAYRLFRAGDIVDHAPVWHGVQAQTPLTIAADLVALLDADQRREMTVTVLYDGPLPAPVEAGMQVGIVRVSAPGAQSLEAPLFAGAGVERMGVLGRVVDTLGQRIGGR